MRVRMLRSHSMATDPQGIEVHTYPEGTIHEVPDDVAKAWIPDGICHPGIGPDETKPMKPPETKADPEPDIPEHLKAVSRKPYKLKARK